MRILNMLPPFNIILWPFRPQSLILKFVLDLKLMLLLLGHVLLIVHRGASSLMLNIWAIPLMLVVLKDNVLMQLGIVGEVGTWSLVVGFASLVVLDSLDAVEFHLLLDDTVNESLFAQMCLNML